MMECINTKTNSLSYLGWSTIKRKKNEQYAFENMLEIPFLARSCRDWKSLLAKNRIFSWSGKVICVLLLLLLQFQHWTIDFIQLNMLECFETLIECTKLEPNIGCWIFFHSIFSTMEFDAYLHRFHCLKIPKFIINFWKKGEFFFSLIEIDRNENMHRKK